MDNSYLEYFPHNGGHSSTVQMYLHLGSVSFALAQASTDAVRLKADATIPLGPAEVEIIVDGVSHRSQVQVLSSESRDNWIDIA